MGMKDRLMQFINYKNISIQAFEVSVNLSNGAVSKMGDGTRRSTIDKISNSYPELNTNWLITGEGEMLRPIQHIEGNSNIVVGRDNNGHINMAECQDRLEDALLEIKHLKEVLEAKDKLLDEKERLINVLMNK